MTYVLVSACLLGEACKYSGGTNTCPQVLELLKRQDLCLIPVCPEQMGGLPTPRIPAERIGSGVFAKDGRDVTEQYHRGAEQAAYLARLYGCSAAILKERSPSCGFGKIYDGTFSGTLVRGNGVAADRLREMNLPIFGESQIPQLKELLDQTGSTERNQNSL